MNAPQRIRILYAEDDKDTCLMTRILLGHSGIEVETARTIESAVRKAKNGEFQAYLLESRFRDGSGLQLCRRLREINPHVPVVFYSGEGLLTGQKIGLAAGAAAYLVKPDIDSIAPTILGLVAEASKSSNRGHRMSVNP